MIIWMQQHGKHFISMVPKDQRAVMCVWQRGVTGKERTKLCLDMELRDMGF